jgi:hypothetical protein
MSSVSFVTIEPSVWQLDASINARQRELLFSRASYVEIVDRLCREARVVRASRNRYKKNPAYFRTLVTIKVSPNACAQFHCGNSGYRAQYYQSTALGEAANRLASARLVDVVASQLPLSRLMPPAWARLSLNGSLTKVWIHQGPWIRHRARADRLLRVERWIEGPHLSKSDRKLALWSTLVPWQEDLLDIKGSFFTLSGEPMPHDPKEHRSQNLHDLGFT